MRKVIRSGGRAVVEVRVREVGEEPVSRDPFGNRGADLFILSQERITRIQIALQIIFWHTKLNKCGLISYKSYNY